MFLTRNIPHRPVLEFLLFKSEGDDHFFALLDRYRIRHTMNVGEAQAGIAQMYASMPAALREWHQKGNARPRLPPPVEAAQWFIDQEMYPFYLNLVARPLDPSSLNPAFQQAWDFFSLCPASRHIVEALSMAGIQTSDLMVVLRQANYPFDVAGLEIYLNQFFGARDLGENDVENYVVRLEEHAKKLQAYGSEARGKRAAINHPGHLLMVVAACGHGLKLPKEVILQQIKSDAMNRMVLSQRMDISDAELARMHASNSVFTGSAGLLVEVLKLEQTTEILGGIVSIDEKISVSLQNSRQNRKTRAEMVTAGEMSIRGLPGKEPGSEN